jgi:hypothetical protein
MGDLSAVILLWVRAAGHLGLRTMTSHPDIRRNLHNRNFTDVPQNTSNYRDLKCFSPIFQLDLATGSRDPSQASVSRLLSRAKCNGR